MRLRILTWNIRRQARAWDFLDEVLEPDIALLQEAVTTKGRANVVYREGGIGDRRRWGSAVATRALPLVAVDRAKNKYTGGVALDLHRTHPGSVAVAEIALPDFAPITAVSVSGLIEHGYANTTVHRIISDLTPLFDSRAGKRLVLGGDLNISTQLDPPYDARSRLIFERLELFGLVDLLRLTADSRGPLEGCRCTDPVCTHVQTLRHRQARKPYQNDYLFASHQLAERLVECRALDSADPDPWAVSDHCPVMAEFEL